MLKGKNEIDRKDWTEEDEWFIKHVSEMGTDYKEALSPDGIVLVKMEFPAGTKVVLDHMNDTQAPPAGTEGVVVCVDDIGTIRVAWENGSCLGVALGEDRCRIIE